MRLSVLCVSSLDECVLQNIDSLALKAHLAKAEFVLHEDHSGCMEYALDEALKKCHGDYVLRLDDDEDISAKVWDWLGRGVFTEDVYTFPRYNLWGDSEHYITNWPLFPDLQTRLTTREKASREAKIHAGSPRGTGMGIHGVGIGILHYKYLLRSHDERKAIAERYEQLQSGAGSGFYLQYSLPEDCMTIQIGTLD